MDYQNELGLLRTVLRGMRIVPRPEEIDQQYLRAENVVLAHSLGETVLLLNRTACDAFDTFCEAIVSKAPDLERGVVFDELRSAILSFIAPLSGMDAGVATVDTAASIHEQVEHWFAAISAPRQVFIPCAITPWESPRFEIGPVQFLYVEQITRSEVYPQLGTRHLQPRCV